MLAISGRVTDLLMAIQEISTVIFEIQVQHRLIPAGSNTRVLTGIAFTRKCDMRQRRAKAMTPES